MKHLYLVVIFFLSSFSINSQINIKGNIKSIKGIPISFATIKVKDKPIGAKTNNEGAFTLNLLEPGNYILEVSNIGFEKLIQKLYIEKDTVINFILLESKVLIKETTIKAEKSKESEQSILKEQKETVIIKETIGAKEMSRKGASDAQAAVVKLAGISKEEGSSQLYIRGLGDRYNTTTLNGMFLPSDNPEYKNISLEYFPIDVIQKIGVSKTFNANLLGDFGGASIDISTKEHFGKPFCNIGVKASLNTYAFSNKNFGSGMGYFGSFDTKEYPTFVEGQFIERAWQPIERKAPKVNLDYNINGGWSLNIAPKAKISFFGTASNSNKYFYFDGISKILYAQGGEAQNFNKKSYTYSTNQNVMLNTTLVVNNKFKSKLNLLGFRTATNQVNEYNGIADKYTDSIYRKRMINDLSKLYVLQSLNELKINNKLSFNLNTSFNIINNLQPDRLTTALISNRVGGYQFLKDYSGDQSSYYQSLEDREMSSSLGSKINIVYDSLNEKEKVNLNVGFTLRYKDRYFEQTDYIFNPDSKKYPNLSLDSIDNAFSLQAFNNGMFTLQDEYPRNAIIDLNKYVGEMKIYSPNISMDIQLTKKAQVNFGLRLDIIDQFVKWKVNTSTPKSGITQPDKEFKFLPFVNYKTEISDNENLKLAFSKTYTLPQFKEMAPFLYFDISTFNTRGNPYLYSSDNYNLDIKYEIFPSKNELVSVTGFGKFIQNPINKIFEASSGLDQMTYANSGELAMVFGTEIEAKKILFSNFENKELVKKYQFLAGLNLSAIYTRQDLNKDKIDKENNEYTTAIFTSTSSALQGASPLVMNTDVTFNYKFKKYENQMTLMFSYFIDRLYSIGAQGAGNVFEKGVPMLDFISKHKFSEKSTISFNIKNILNPSIERYQEVNNTTDYTIFSFKKGIDFSLGFNYNF